MSSHALYRFWNAADELLYVGISVSPWDRWRQHRGEKAWWEEVATITLETFPSRDEVLAAELRAIRAESPRYNIAGLTEANCLQRRVVRDVKPLTSADSYANLVRIINLEGGVGGQLLDDKRTDYLLLLDLDDF